jgi:hypothetical protein
MHTYIILGISIWPRSLAVNASAWLGRSLNLQLLRDKTAIKRLLTQKRARTELIQMLIIFEYAGRNRTSRKWRLVLVCWSGL